MLSVTNLSLENNFAELKLVTDNILSTYAAANWEATERKTCKQSPCELMHEQVYETAIFNIMDY